MRAGTMRDRVTLERFETAPDPRWGNGGGWAIYDNRWASVTAISGLEKFAGQQVQAEVTHGIRMRYRPGVTAKDRIGYRGDKLEIVSVFDPDGTRAELVIMAVQLPEEGGTDA